jgi:predicted adenine nucleotide alpha hydrolase (AANH) superfamily ATPase
LQELKNSEVLIFFYNPNIQPYTEYELRRDCLEKYCQSQGVKFVEGSYDIDRFFQDVVFREHVRCSICYKLRLTEAVKYAKRGDFDFFTTTLLVSPYQKHNVIRDLGQSIGEKYGVPFLYRDFREGWKETISISLELGLYRQRYCGCVYSERERFHKDYKKSSRKTLG